MHPNRSALRAIRERSGLTRRGLAILAGLHHSTIARIEEGEQEQIRPDTAAKIAAALQVPIVAITQQLVPAAAERVPEPV